MNADIQISEKKKEFDSNLNKIEGQVEKINKIIIKKKEILAKKKTFYLVAVIANLFGMLIGSLITLITTTKM